LTVSCLFFCDECWETWVSLLDFLFEWLDGGWSSSNYLVEEWVHLLILGLLFVFGVGALLNGNFWSELHFSWDDCFFCFGEYVFVCFFNVMLSVIEFVNVWA
jgi:hypothetical protein